MTPGSDWTSQHRPHDPAFHDGGWRYPGMGHESGPAPAPSVCKSGPLVWVISGIVAMALAGALLAGLFMFEGYAGNSAGADTATKPPASPSPVRDYRAVENLCSHTTWDAVRRLAPRLADNGRRKDDASTGFTRRMCEGALYSDNEGNIAPLAIADYHDNPAGAEKAYREIERKCQNANGNLVPDLGQAACIQDEDLKTGSERTVLRSSLTVWDGDLLLRIELYGGWSFNDKPKQLHNAAIADAATLLEDLHDHA